MNQKQKIFKIAIILIVIIFFIYLTVEFFPLFKGLLTEEGRNAFKGTVDGLGFKGIFVILGLMCVQIIIPIFPGEPVEVLAGMCFGPIKGLLVILLGVFLSTVIIISLVKFLGKNFIYSFVKKEKVDKIENSKFFKNTKRIDILVFLLFCIPGTPKDILTYIAVLLPINIYRFLVISTIARIPSVISSTIVGSSLLTGNLIFSIGVYAVTFLITGIFIYIVNKKDKNIMKMVDEIK